MAGLREILHEIRTSGLTNDDLNLVVEAIKYARNQNARKAASTLKIGAQVKFNGRSGIVQGRLESIKIKNATVSAGNLRYRVPLSMLEEA